MSLNLENRSAPLELQEKAAYEFFWNMPLPAFVINREEDIYMFNAALAATFGYDHYNDLFDILKKGDFLLSHFPHGVLAQFYELMAANGHLENWLLRGRSQAGRELTLEITARGRVKDSGQPDEFLEAYFIYPGNIRDAEAFLQMAQKEAALTAKVKTEFLSNINHELRTPLNIIIGMLDLSLEGEKIEPESRFNLGLAKEAADGLFTILNDLIALSNLEARRLDIDFTPFNPQLLLRSLTNKFAAKADSKGVKLLAESDEHVETIVDGGYNFIALALEKLVDNAIKFVEPHKGQVQITALIHEDSKGPLLQCSVLDNGPGLDQCFLESQELFRQGDSTINRRYGGLGLGLRLATNLVDALGGRFKLANCVNGGAEISFEIPVKFSSL